MTLYNLRSALDDYRITKFDADMNVESSYIIGAAPPHECECPAGTRPTCRHRQMLPDLLPLLDTEYFWDFERHTCVNSDGVVCEPSGVAVVPEAEPTAWDPILPGDIGEEVRLVNVPPPTVTLERPKSGFGANLPPGVRIPNQKGSWRRI